ncbi:RHS repeat-associated core domain-containing protein [Sorangium sp. So ce134]
MARTAPVPNIPAIPGMNPGVWIMGGGGGGGGGNGRGGNGSGNGQGAGGGNGGNDAQGGGKGAGSCGPGSGAGCPNPSHGGGGGTHAGDPIDPMTGRVYTVPAVDLALPGPLPLVIKRTYSSTARERDVGLGRGWAHSLAWEIEPRRRTLLLYNPEGTHTRALLPAIGESVVLSRGVLTRHDWGYTLVIETGDVLVFSGTQANGARYALSRIVDPSGNSIDLAYADGRLSSIIDSVKRTVRVRRHADGRIAAFEVKNSPHQGQWVAFRRYRYDSAGHLVAAEDAAGRSVRYSYDDGLLTSLVYPSGLLVCFRYDARRRCVETWTEAPGTTDALDERAPAFLADGMTRARGMLHCKVEHGGDGYVELVTSRDVKRYSGNEHGKLEKAVWGPGVHTNTFDSIGNVTSYTDPTGACWRWDRDAFGRVVREIDPLGAVQEYAYNERGLLASMTDPVGAEFHFEYNDGGKLLAIDGPGGNAIAYKRDRRGLPIEATMPDGAITRMDYDALGNRVVVTEPDGGRRFIEYDYLGQVLGFTDERGGTTRYVYGPCRELRVIRLPDGVTIGYDYDEDGRLAAVTDPMGRRCELVWSGMVVHEVRRPDGARVRFRYDREGDLLRVIHGSGEEHVLVRSPAGRIIEERTFEGRTIRYKHDLLGRIVQSESGSGEVTEFKYDLVGRLVERVYADGTVDRFEYDPAGRLLRAESSASETAFRYDGRGRLVAELHRVNGRSYVVESSYDAAGNRTRRSTSLGYVESMVYDPMGQPTRILLDDSETVEIGWDSRGFEARRALPGGGLIQSACDSIGRITHQRVFRPSGQPRAAEPAWAGPRPPGLTEEHYHAYTLAGDLLEEWGLVEGRTAYTYDPVSQVISRVPQHARAELFGYDAAENVHEAGPAAQLRRYEPGGKLIRRGDVDYLYDADARLIEKRRNAEPGRSVCRYRWNARGLLEAIELDDGTVIEFAYDAFARRVEKRVRRRGEAARATRFVWDGDTVVHEVREAADPQGNTVVHERTYSFLPRSRAPLAHRDALVQASGKRAEGGWIHYINDPVGHPRALVSGQGEVLGRIHRSVWGQVDAGAPDQATTPLRFPGQYADDETGVVYNRYRYYDPEIGRYISPDPLGLAGGLRPFGYASNRPLAMIDPDGLAPVRASVQGPYSNGPFGSSTDVRSGQRHYGGGDRLPGQLHPAVQDALVPVYNGVSARGQADALPHYCAEPWAMTNYIRNYEHANGIPPNTMNPQHPNWNDCIGSIQSITAQQGQTGRIPCPNCSQMLANLGVQSHQVPPVNGQNFSQPDRGWASQHQGPVVHLGFR